MRIRFYSTFILLFSIALTIANAQPFRDLYSDTWVAVDALGRSLPTAEECGPPNADKTVGIFYFLWLGQHGTAGPFDITELLKQNPKDPQWGPPGAFHHWGKSELGYYTSDSDYVIRQHARLLTDAGVDTLIFDVTNAFTYPDVYTKICRIYTELRSDGQQTPQIIFLTHSSSKKTIETLYNDFYAKNLYPDLWFRWKGKPLILGSAENLPQNIRDFFTIRDCWAWTHGRDTWQWLDNWPQQYGWHESADRPEEVAVCVAQHPTSNIGRSHYKGKQPRANSYGVTPYTDKGVYFQQQWDRALEINPEFLFITGWNEWVAQRFIKQAGQPPAEMIGKPMAAGQTYFVDTYSQEYSRDIEPMEGGHTDNYYYQMIAGIRKYKGVRQPQPASAPKTISIDGLFGDWNDVAPEFRDCIGDVEHRNEKGWGNAGQYINTTGRNDLTVLKVARDKENIYFYARTQKPLTSRNGNHWMMLFIDSDQNHATGWEGYDFATNLTVFDETTTSLHALKGSGFNPAPKGKITYAVADNQYELAIPRSLLNIPADGPVAFDFHWADNIQETGDILEFARSGDSAPDRRFNYRYIASQSNTAQPSWLLGGDISMLTRLEEQGVVFKDAAGTPTDCIKLMTDAGCNCFRLRLFVNPTGKGGVIQDVPYTLALAHRIKDAGAKLLLDFHYSDTWADPGKQFKPKAWEDLSFEQLQKQIEDYTAEVITEFKNQNCLPDIVQVGNEITPGFLWPDARLNGDDPTQWKKFTTLLKAAIQGVQKPLSSTDHVRIMIHIDRGGDKAATRWFFSNLQKYHVPFDIIGLSYYPWWHGSMQNLADNLQSTAAEFNKDILVAETAYPHSPVDVSRDTHKDAMIWPMTPEGQKTFLDELIKTVHNTPGNHGIGVIWWYPESVPANKPGGWYGGANALFDKNGKALPALESFFEASKQHP